MKTKTKTRYEVQFNVCGKVTLVTIEAYTPRQAYNIARQVYNTSGPVLVRNPRNTYWLMTEQS